jgi:RNA-directed DNA polymerase
VTSSPPLHYPQKFDITFCVRGVFSPLLANVYLHYVFDLWIEAWRKKVARGKIIVVRYADDLVVGFESRAEAELFLKAFKERLAKFGLELNAEKTRLIEFGRFAAPNREQRGEGKPETFTFLGFTHYCGKRRGNGAFIVWRKTAKKRMIAKLRAIKAELRFRMHEPVASVGAWLQKVVVGYYQYHAVPGNLDRLRIFGQRLRRLWRLVLSRRSEGGMLPWDRVAPIFHRWIPIARVLHPYPMERFVAIHPRWEPYA